MTSREVSRDVCVTSCEPSPPKSGRDGTFDSSRRSAFFRSRSRCFRIRFCSRIRSIPSTFWCFDEIYNKVSENKDTIKKNLAATHETRMKNDVNFLSESEPPKKKSQAFPFTLLCFDGISRNAVKASTKPEFKFSFSPFARAAKVAIRTEGRRNSLSSMISTISPRKSNQRSRPA